DVVVGGLLGVRRVVVGGGVPGGINGEGGEVHRFLQPAGNVNRGQLHRARRGNDLAEHVAVDVRQLRVRVGGQEGADAVQRLGHGGAVAAGEEAGVGAGGAVVAGAAGEPVVARVAAHVVVLSLAEQDVAALLPVGEVVARLAVDLVGGTDVAGRRGGVVVGAARRVVEQPGRADDDAHAAAVLVRQRQRGRVVVELEVRL